jgi:hypothetical protein
VDEIVDLKTIIRTASSSSDEISAIIYAPALLLAHYLASLNDEDASSQTQQQEVHLIIDQNSFLPSCWLSKNQGKTFYEFWKRNFYLILSLPWN